ncbi:permease prefix domain 1-containing protein [Dactylosporangium sp. NPDC049525]|uniref:permease prefix domain 1-containing protein n=1 Tax=Dactylosporangium sp. NPDC049525 TaxID=3154730 RepID=UPI003417DE62
MAGHRLIDATVTALARRLPADAVDELADGLTETYLHHLSRGLDPDAAANAAIAEFGEPHVVIAAFVRQSPGRHVAKGLIVSGPAVGACWAVALIAGHAWTWPVPVPIRLGLGLTLLAVVTTLALAATTRRNYRLTRAAAVGGLGLIGLDAALLAAVALLPAAFTWPLIVATAASLVRLVLTARALPRLFTG